MPTHAFRRTLSATSYSSSERRYAARSIVLSIFLFLFFTVGEHITNSTMQQVRGVCLIMLHYFLIPCGRVRPALEGQGSWFISDVLVANTYIPLDITKPFAVTSVRNNGMER
jgi:hypothetical protein